MLSMLLTYTTFITALFGLAFGSFLNVCASRLSAGESIVSPGSHCRSCKQPLRWRENIPLVSWLVLRGRCSNCGARIGWRYPVVEAAVAFTWAIIVWHAGSSLSVPLSGGTSIFEICVTAAADMVLCWLLILLATLDAEYLWLPNILTLGGSVIGLLFILVRFSVRWAWQRNPLQAILELEKRNAISADVLVWLMGIVIAPLMILFLRWTYRFLRHREGIGLGDAKLMLLLAVWLGLGKTILAFVLGVLLGTVFALFLLAVPRARRDKASWLLNRIPLGTFLSIGGILSTIWGATLIDDYLRASGLK